MLYVIGCRGTGGAFLTQGEEFLTRGGGLTSFGGGLTRGVDVTEERGLDVLTSMDGLTQGGGWMSHKGWGGLRPGGGIAPVVPRCLTVLLLVAGSNIVLYHCST